MKRSNRRFTGESASGRWRFFYRRDIPDLVDPDDIYLTRWKILETPWFGIYLHRIRRPDNDRNLHDHPWPFLTLILRNGYVESFAPFLARATTYARLRRDVDPLYAPPARRVWYPFTVHVMRRGQFHAITRFLHPDRDVWSLVLVGRRSNDWGYATPEGFVGHDEYHARWWGKKAA